MGKTAILYVLGLGLIVSVALVSINHSSTDSVTTFTEYYGRTMAHNIATAGANIGASRILFNVAYNTAFSDSFGGGQFSVRFDSIGLGQKRMLVVSSYNNSTWGMYYDTVVANFTYVIFTRYGWFTEKEANGYVGPDGVAGPYSGADDWKISGDSVFGYAHSNGHFNLDGTPYFDKRVTAGTAPSANNHWTSAGDPIYNQGYEWGVNIPRDTARINDLRGVANSGLPTNVQTMLTNHDISLDFKNNGTVRVKAYDGSVAWGSSAALMDTTVDVSSLSTGVIGAVNGDVHISGTYKGRVTAVALTGTGSTALKGNVWIDDNIVAKDSPRSNPASNDMMGIVANRMSYITQDLSRHSTSVLNIDAAIYVHNGEFTAQNFWTIPLSGRVSLFGAMTQKTAGSLGVFGSGGITNGFFYSIRSDPRFLNQAPPSYPYSRKYRLVSWWEN
jgi:hypothetical protein